MTGIDLSRRGPDTYSTECTEADLEPTKQMIRAAGGQVRHTAPVTVWDDDKRVPGYHLTYTLPRSNR